MVFTGRRGQASRSYGSAVPQCRSSQKLLFLKPDHQKSLRLPMAALIVYCYLIVVYATSGTEAPRYLLPIA